MNNDFLQNNFIDIACVQETMLFPTNHIPINHNFTTYRLDRDEDTNSRPSGGVAVMVRRTIKHELLPALSLKLIEAIGERIFLNNGSHIEVWSVYLPSGSSINHVKQHYSHDISILTNKRCSYFINGD